MLSILPQLEKLDEQPVSLEEISVARQLYPDLPVAPQSPSPAARGSSSYGAFPAKDHQALTPAARFKACVLVPVILVLVQSNGGRVETPGGGSLLDMRLIQQR